MSNIKILKFKEHRTQHLIGFIDIEIPRVGMVIRGIRWFNKNGSEWFALPGEKYTDKDGEEKWKSHILFPDKRISTAFQDCLGREIRAYVKNTVTAVEQPPTDEVPF